MHFICFPDYSFVQCFTFRLLQWSILVDRGRGLGTCVPHCQSNYFSFLLAATKLGQGNIFTGICLFTGGSASVHALIYPLGPDPPGPHPRTTPLGPDSPGTRPLLAPDPSWHQTPLAPDPPQHQIPLPWHQTPHPPEADSSIWSTSGWYASYWNVFLSCSFFRKNWPK